jgi:hypothetical protein
MDCLVNIARAGIQSVDTSAVTTVDAALSFIRDQGVVLVSGKGPAARLTELISGEPIRGSWWAHPASHQIFAVLQAISASKDVLTCRLIDGKLTLVHRRLWPALVRAADLFSAYQLAQVRQQHTPSGHHMNSEVPFPQWVPHEVLEAGKRLAVQEARAAFEQWAPAPPVKLRSSRRSAKRGPRRAV